MRRQREELEASQKAQVELREGLVNAIRGVDSAQERLMEQVSHPILRTESNAHHMYTRINLFKHMTTSLQYHSNVLTLMITSLQNDP